MKNKFIFSLCFIVLLNFNLKAVSLDDVVDDVIGSLDKKFDNIFSDSLSLSETCYGTKFDFNIDLDVCKIASLLDQIKFDSCSLIGGEGGRQVGISGANLFCKAQMRKFSDYASKQASDFADYSSLNIDDESKEFLAKLPNGQDVKTYLRTWDINQITNKNSPDNQVLEYLKQGKQDVVNLFMEYSKTNGAKVDPAQIKIEDLKAPETLEDYKKGITQSVRNYKKILEDTSPNNISSLVRSKIQSGSNNEDLAKKIVEDNKKQFDLAKNIEIGQVLSSSNYEKIAIPTQEYINGIRKDLRPEIIAKIRKQQAYEIAKISEIEEKWQRKYEIAKILADKEIILAQKFDEKSAKEEINKIIENANIKE
ncbi:hypothetical protein B0619_07815 [Campylobacter lari]|nr:hypothetical protein [Campylobacter lari]EAK5787102.1 hypothetical protein [Campylobacter lari]